MISIEMCIRLKENNLGLYVRGSNEILHKVVKKVTENLMEKEDFKKNIRNEFEWYKKRTYGQFVHEIPEEIDKDLFWKWLVQSDLQMETEAVICASLEQALRTNYTNIGRSIV